MIDYRQEGDQEWAGKGDYSRSSLTSVKADQKDLIVNSVNKINCSTLSKNSRNTNCSFACSKKISSCLLENNLQPGSHNISCNSSQHNLSQNSSVKCVITLQIKRLGSLLPVKF